MQMKTGNKEFTLGKKLVDTIPEIAEEEELPSTTQAAGTKS